MKPENWQLTGFFKIRGALNALSGLSEEDRQRGVITASAGNHAKGVALADQMLGISVAVVVPTNIPQTKLDGVRQMGADVIIAGDYRVGGGAHSRAGLRPPLKPDVQFVGIEVRRVTTVAIGVVLHWP